MAAACLDCLGLALLRRVRHLSQYDAARSAGIATARWGMLERGEAEPEPGEIEGILRKLDVESSNWETAVLLIDDAMEVLGDTDGWTREKVRE